MPYSFIQQQNASRKGYFEKNALTMLLQIQKVDFFVASYFCYFLKLPKSNQGSRKSQQVITVQEIQVGNWHLIFHCVAVESVPKNVVIGSRDDPVQCLLFISFAINCLFRKIPQLLLHTLPIELKGFASKMLVGKVPRPPGENCCFCPNAIRNAYGRLYAFYQKVGIQFSLKDS